jgi:Tol biopolymer transport system component
MKKLDRVAILVMLSTIALLAVVIWMGGRIPITVRCQSPVDCAQVSPFGLVTLEFSRPVSSDLVEALWQTEPNLAGRWEWQDDRHASWLSTTPMLPGQKIEMQLTPGKAGKNGESIQDVYHWEATVRSPQIVVSKSLENGGQELYSVGLDGESSLKQLTYSNGDVFDFEILPEGEAILYSALNDSGGTDLWIVQRDGSGAHILLECGSDRCTTPTASPAAPEIAYTRESAGLDPNGPKGAPRVWILDEITGQTTPLFADPQKIGHGPVWSPDGKWLSIWNGIEGGIMVVQRQTGDTMMLESSNGDSGSWSPDSQSLYYTNMIQGMGSFRNVVLKADIAQGTVATVMGKDVESGGLSIGVPVCDPTGKWVAVTIQPDPRIPGRELSLFDPEGLNGIPILEDLTKLPTYYSWTPTGDKLVFQIYPIGGKEDDVETWVWDRETGDAQKIVAGARFPKWLP